MNVTLVTLRLGVMMKGQINCKLNQSRLQPGTLLCDNYEIEGIYGAGGFAVVYKALQRNLGRRVAIKILNSVKAGDDGDSTIRRFLQEARAAANINHNNVVKIYDVGFLNDRRPYIVMESFDGHDMKKQLRKHGPMTATRWLPLFDECLGALAQAHQAGIIHRDLKPDNLVLTMPGTRDESLKLIDFGIARLRHRSDDLTCQSLRLGTARYMTPEYIRLNQVSPALDVFQMGLVLVEGLTGQPVIQGENDAQCIHMITEGDFTVPAALRASALGPIIEKSLAMDPSQRFPHAAAMRAALAKLNARGPLNIDTRSIQGPARQDDIIAAHSADLLCKANTLPHHSGAARAMADSVIFTPPQVDFFADPSSVTAKITPGGGGLRVLWILGGGALCVMGLGLVGMTGLYFETLLTMNKVAANPHESLSPPPLEVPATTAAQTPPKRVTVHVEPAHATIYLGDKLMGVGNATVEIPDEALTTLTLFVEARGYESSVVSLSAPYETSPRVSLKPIIVAEERPTPKIGAVNTGPSPVAASSTKRPARDKPPRRRLNAGKAKTDKAKADKAKTDKAKADKVKADARHDAEPPTVAVKGKAEPTKGDAEQDVKCNPCFEIFD